jgi:hypothetical protein
MSNDLHSELALGISRRAALGSLGGGFSGLVLTALLADESHGAASAAPSAGSSPLAPRSGHFPARAKAVIQLCQNGGPSQMDLFDPKPELSKRSGQPYPGEVETFQLGNKNVLLGSPFTFSRHGACGMELSEVIPHLGTVADDLCLVRSMHTDNNNHPFALNTLQTGKVFAGRPAMGSWITYALGSENRDLPAYVVLRDPAGYNTSGKMVWSSGWLPAIYQGTEFASQGAPVLHLEPARKSAARRGRPARRSPTGRRLT